jgi:hypothetical protein
MDFNPYQNYFISTAVPVVALRVLQQVPQTAEPEDQVLTDVAVEVEAVHSLAVLRAPAAVVVTELL